jgi:beta-lysine 5,6-aminomutase beta subunit
MEKREIQAVNPKAVFPYGDTTNDGAMQLSFTLPIKAGALAKEAARKLIKKMGFEKGEVVTMQELGGDFTFFVVYAFTSISVDITDIKVVEAKFDHMSRVECDEYIDREIGRPLVVVGATIESDAHTVGLDAILNMKGYHGDYGLERYRNFEVYNMGSQVACEELIKKAKEVKADTVLVSQIVTQKNIHIKNLTKLMDMMEAEGLRNKIIAAVGGPRIGHELALELGYDIGFGPGTIPSQVASYIATTIKERMENE